MPMHSENINMILTRITTPLVLDRVSSHKQENGSFDRTTLYHKILCEIKQIKSGNDRSFERGFLNSGCFHR